MIILGGYGDPPLPQRVDREHYPHAKWDKYRSASCSRKKAGLIPAL
jgi:hypothetical protein